MIHMKGGYDHRYYAGKLRDTIVDILLKIRKCVSAKFMNNHQADNIYAQLEQDYNLYLVKDKKLKGHCTMKNEAAKGKYKRPPDSSKVDEKTFLESLLMS